MKKGRTFAKRRKKTTPKSKELSEKEIKLIKDFVEGILMAHKITKSLKATPNLLNQNQ